MKKCIPFLLAVLMLVPQVPVYAGSDEASGSSFEISKESRFYIVTEGEPAEDVLETVKTADQFFAAAKVPSGDPLDIVYGRAKYASEGDIVITLEEEGKEETSDSQSYQIKTAKGMAVIVAPECDGLYYGLEDILKRFIAEGSRISCDVEESPVSDERTILLDCGRKYYSPEWIENLLYRMSWQKYNALHLHFSDAQGFGIESKKYPWLTEGRECLSYEDLEKICQVAKACHVDIVPELDTPGHMEYIIKAYRQHVADDPEFSFEYGGKTYSKEDEGFLDISNYYVYRGSRSRASDAGIDLSNDVARAFADSLIDEYADFFADHGSRSICLGGDELFGWDSATVGGRTFDHTNLWQALEHWQTYAAEKLGQPEWNGADVFIDYMNKTSSRLEKKGYRCRMWNDQLHRVEDQSVELDPDIEVIYWSNDYCPAEQIAQEGHMLYNSDTRWCYYVIRRDKQGGDIMDRTRKNCNAQNIYENWDPRSCGAKSAEPFMIPEETFAGGYFAIWADQQDYKDEKTVWDDTVMRTWANSTKLWEGAETDQQSYADFKEYTQQIGLFPGYGGDPAESVKFEDAPEPVKIKGNFFENIIDWFTSLI